MECPGQIKQDCTEEHSRLRHTPKAGKAHVSKAETTRDSLFVSLLSGTGIPHDSHHGITHHVMATAPCAELRDSPICQSVTLFLAKRTQNSNLRDHHLFHQ